MTAGEITMNGRNTPFICFIGFGEAGQVRGPLPRNEREPVPAALEADRRGHASRPLRIAPGLRLQSGLQSRRPSGRDAQKRPDQRSNEKLERDDRGHRVARQPENEPVASPAEDRRLPRLHRDSPEDLFDAQAAERLRNFIEKAAPPSGTEITLLDPQGRILVDYDPVGQGWSEYRRNPKVIGSLNLAEKNVAAAVEVVAARETVETAATEQV